MRTKAKMRIGYVATMLATGLLVVGGATPAGATFPGENGRIAFESAMVTKNNPEGDSEIFTMNPDGSGLRQLTRNEDRDTSPVFSPTGGRIAFESSRDSASLAHDIFVMHDDGSRQRNVTASPVEFDGGATWSPNGKKLAFHSRRDDNTDVFKMNVDGSGQRNLTAGSEYLEEYPAWSPAGGRIAFQSNRDAEGFGTDDIFVMNADGSGPKNLTETVEDIDHLANWSPDGGRITFTIQDGDSGDNDVYTMKPDGTGQRNLTRNPGADDSLSVYSPDGKHVAFESDRDADAIFGSDIFTMKADGSRQKNVTDRSGEFTSDPDWQRKR